MRILDKLPRENGREYATRIIKYNITHAEIAPGALISANDLTAELHLSRTPINEALLELSKTGIIEVLPQVGSRVALIDYALVEEARFTRMILEEAVVDIVCQRITESQLRQIEECIMRQELYMTSGQNDLLMDLDNQFHKMLFDFSDMTRSYMAIQNLEIHFDRVRALSFNVVADMKIVQDHKAIYAAIAAKEAEMAKKLVRKHLSQYLVDKERICKTYPQYLKKAEKCKKNAALTILSVTEKLD